MKTAHVVSGNDGYRLEIWEQALREVLAEELLEPFLCRAIGCGSPLARIPIFAVLTWRVCRWTSGLFKRRVRLSTPLSAETVERYFPEAKDVLST